MELRAAQNASETEMFTAAKHLNAYWFPQQALEVATFLKAAQNVDFAQAEAALVMSRQYSSGSGCNGLHQWLGENALLTQSPSGGGTCSVQYAP